VIQRRYALSNEWNEKEIINNVSHGVSIKYSVLRGAKQIMSSTVKNIRPKAVIQIPEPPISRFLFADTRMAWVWLIVRLYVGYQWFTAGFEKLTGYSATIGNTFGVKVGNSWIFTDHLGAALTAFAHSGIAQATGPYPAVQGWYAWFLQNAVIPWAGFWSYLVTFGELAVGIGLIIGMLTGIAAFFGVFMNMNFMLAGAVSINPIIGGLAIFLILAWRIAGYYGVDRWLLPLLGTPWTGSLAKEEVEEPKQTSTPPVASVS
jgi:thiosulfate dehydrogenase [quinone] large subunit